MKPKRLEARSSLACLCLASVVGVCFTACVTTPEKPDLLADPPAGAEDDSASAGTSGRPTASKPPPNFSRPTTAQLNRWAARFVTANNCEATARRIAYTKPKRGFRRLAACSRRQDFDVFEPLLRTPWLTLIRQAKLVGVDILARSMAKRGQIYDDVASCQAAGIDLTALDSKSSFGDLEGRFIVAAGIVEKPTATVDMVQLSYELPGQSQRRAGGYRRYYNYTARGSRYLSYRGDTGGREMMAWYMTERHLRFRKVKCPVSKGDIRMIVGKMAVSQRSPGEPLIDNVGWIEVIGCYPVDLRLENK